MCDGINLNQKMYEDFQSISAKTESQDKRLIYDKTGVLKGQGAFGSKWASLNPKAKQAMDTRVVNNFLDGLKHHYQGTHIPTRNRILQYATAQLQSVLDGGVGLKGSDVKRILTETERMHEASNDPEKALMGNRFFMGKYMDLKGDFVQPSEEDGKRLTEIEINSVYIYTRGKISPTRDAYKAMNEYLRGDDLKKSEIEQDVPEIWALVGRAFSGLRKLPDYTGEVHRVVSDLPKSVLDQYQVGSTVIEKGFTSTSKSSGGEGDIKFVIQSKHGKDVETLSGHPSEKEVLFGPGAMFEITARSESEEDGTIVIHMKEVDPE